MDPKQQEMSNYITKPKLHKMANSSFTDIFARRKHEVDRCVIQFLQKDVFEKQVNKSDTDERLKMMMDQGTHIVFNYVSLVLFPEVFTSWVRSRKEGITEKEASQLYQSIGNVVTQKEKDIFDKDIRQQIIRYQEQKRYEEEEDNDYDEEDEEQLTQCLQAYTVNVILIINGE